MRHSFKRSALYHVDKLYPIDLGFMEVVLPFPKDISKRKEISKAI
ncbi:MAG: hypothetical protein ACFFG0_49685 [Candidatus Thorarchaeota archaeon]